MFKLREYQQQASDRAVDFFNSKTEMNAIEVLPTGSGKSLVIADIANRLEGHTLVFQPSKEILEQNYKKWFHQDMQYALPRFAITGYDQGCFFFRGLHEKGEKFDGSTQPRPSVQTPFRFERVAKKAGYKNQAFQLIHYNTNGAISIVNY